MKSVSLGKSDLQMRALVSDIGEETPTKATAAQNNAQIFIGMI